LDLHNVLAYFKLPIIVYLSGISVISLLIVYTIGPIKNPRIIICFKYSLKLASFLFIIKGVSDLNTFFSMVISFLLFYLLFSLANSDIIENINKIIWKPVFIRKFLTIEEYDNQATLFTKSKLVELKKFCQSSDCDSWVITSKLQQARRYDLLKLLLYTFNDSQATTMLSNLFSLKVFKVYYT